MANTFALHRPFKATATVAQRVETDEQLALLREVGYELAQGVLLLEAVSKRNTIRTPGGSFL